MAINAEQEIARADMNDALGVSVWQHKKLTDFTPDEARQFAREIAAAADEADRVRVEMEEEARLPRLAHGGIVASGNGPVIL